MFKFLAFLSQNLRFLDLEFTKNFSNFTRISIFCLNSRTDTDQKILITWSEISFSFYLPDFYNRFYFHLFINVFFSFTFLKYEIIATLMITRATHKFPFLECQSSCYSGWMRLLNYKGALMTYESDIWRDVTVRLTFISFYIIFFSRLSNKYN